MFVSELESVVHSLTPKLVAWRRELHQHPELGLECAETAALVIRELENMGLEVRTGLAQTGVAALLRGKGDGPTVGFRVDMDALPIEEKTGLPFASRRPGIMHACGHDGHTVIGLGAAAVLSKFKDQIRGNVKFIFQPGEEWPGGAKFMIEDGVLEDPAMDAILGCHIHPSLPAGRVGVCFGTATAGNYEFEISIKGHGGHGARPHECKDPIVAAAHLIVALQTIVSRRNDPLDPLVLTIGEIQGGRGHNVIPEEVVLKGIIRYLSERAIDAAVEEFDRILGSISLGFNVNIETKAEHEAPPMLLNDDLSEVVEAAARDLFGPDKVDRVTQPSMGAEDFAYFSNALPSAYFRLGCLDEAQGLTYGIHNARFDFNEEILGPGVKAAVFFILNMLEKGESS